MSIEVMFSDKFLSRYENNAIIVHGTMCLIRRAALEAAGGWSSDTICEDTDLGLSILELGWLAHYTNRRYGHGCCPTPKAYKTERDRWAYGGFQIIQKHGQRFLPGASGFRATRSANSPSAGSTGSAPRDRRRGGHPQPALGPGPRLAGIAIPDKILTIPILAAFVVSLLHFVTLYGCASRSRAARCSAPCLRPCRCSGRWRARSAFGLFKDTCRSCAPPGRRDPQAARFPAFWEAVLGRSC